MALPVALKAMQDDRDEVASLVERLERPLEAESRADLAVELVRFVARYEDIKDRGVFPVLDRRIEATAVAPARSGQEALREVLGEVRRRTRHVKPINAHADDPEGFDLALDDLVQSVRLELDGEATALLPLVDQLDPAGLAELQESVEIAAAHASEHPGAHRHKVTHWLRNVEEKFEHVVHDAATISHPAVSDMGKPNPDEGSDRAGHQATAGPSAS